MVGRPELADDLRFRSNSDRVGHKQELTEELQAAMAERDGKLLAQELLQSGVPAGAVLFVDEALAAAHTRHRNMLIEQPTYRGIATPIKFSRSRPERVRPPPRFGEHNEEVLAEHDFSGAERAQLETRGVVLNRRKDGD